ncbi:MAG: glucosamine-6-phosphate deaminase [Acidimicrobiales bacterium]|nr:glucosamine-6-phosphate deaminase [Acidimicrobiaceae bacterium]MXV88976.1 glucosamine-6-phosphate deaminase [Acidimicrobiales bacterium]MXX41645.1 glucosamine-6-phosphate deaminase [Acidimicrobiales bacterium]MXY02796.1 glucosamine-6-phosphate deaminase [Acidimicrobiales bacterium]MXZ16568.1 glucosamine-6-phosphate deaminase [Acidimicrobiales bacterium]
MNIFVAPDRTAAALRTADLVEQLVNATAPTALGIATGETMEAPLAEIVRRHRRGTLNLASTEVYLLDEYIGLQPDDPCSFANTVNRLLVEPTGISPGAVHGPDPHTLNLYAECAGYERRVRAARIQLQLLGIGTNGHIAFNEPGSSFASSTRVVRLSEQTRSDNARSFPDGAQPPAAAITQGIGTILMARELLLVACGQQKAQSVARAVEGPVTRSLPASALQLHPNVTVVLDPPAAALLADDARQPCRRNREEGKDFYQ